MLIIIIYLELLQLTSLRTNNFNVTFIQLTLQERIQQKLYAIVIEEMLAVVCTLCFFCYIAYIVQSAAAFKFTNK